MVRLAVNKRHVGWFGLAVGLGGMVLIGYAVVTVILDFLASPTGCCVAPKFLPAILVGLLLVLLSNAVMEFWRD